MLTLWKFRLTVLASLAKRCLTSFDKLRHSSASTFERSDALMSGCSFCNCGLRNLEKIMKLLRGLFGVPRERVQASTSAVSNCRENSSSIPFL